MHHFWVCAATQFRNLCGFNLKYCVDSLSLRLNSPFISTLSFSVMSKRKKRIWGINFAPCAEIRVAVLISYRPNTTSHFWKPKLCTRIAVFVIAIVVHLCHVCVCRISKLSRKKTVVLLSRHSILHDKQRNLLCFWADFLLWLWHPSPQPSDHTHWVTRNACHISAKNCLRSFWSMLSTNISKTAWQLTNIRCAICLTRNKLQNTKLRCPISLTASSACFAIHWWKRLVW